MAFGRHSVKGFFNMICGVALILAAMPAGASEAGKTGPENISIFGGVRGDVHFPHWMHQKTIGDCNVCHHIFPQTKGSIEALKAEGKLKNKQVMDSLCIKCHRERKMKGMQGGPTTCSKCHSGS